MEILRAEPRCLLKQMYDMSARTPNRLMELKTQVEFLTASWETGEAHSGMSYQGFTFSPKRMGPRIGVWQKKKFVSERATKGARLFVDRKKWRFPPRSVTVAGPYKLSADNEARCRSGPPGRRRPNYAQTRTRRPRANVWFISSRLAERERR